MTRVAASSCEQCGATFSARVRRGVVVQRFCGYSCSARARAEHRHAGDRNPNWRGGKTLHPLYDCYMDMLGRCYRPTHARFSDYGGRGITVCEAWRADFWVYAADVGPRPRPGMSLDRIDNDGNYEPSNVRWATPSQQVRNSRLGWRKRRRNQMGQFA